MKVDHCFILAAGFGTRMGLIGKELPKILWPVFEKTLLELQVEFAQKLGINSISFNLHYQADQVLKYRSENTKISMADVFYEEEVLDIGGGIHNFAKANGYQGNVLVLNADQFLMFDLAFLNSIKDNGQVATLFTKTVNKKDGYNKLLISDNLLKDIISNQDISEEKFQTYSGCSIINLTKLNPSTGPSSFFKTIANYKEERVECVNTDSFEYNDFGTKDRYFESIFAVLKNKRPVLKKFLLETNGFENSSIVEHEYKGKILVESDKISLDGSPITGLMRFNYKGIEDN